MELDQKLSKYCPKEWKREASKVSADLLGMGFAYGGGSTSAERKKIKIYKSRRPLTAFYVDVHFLQHVGVQR